MWGIAQNDGNILGFAPANAAANRVYIFRKALRLCCKPQITLCRISLRCGIQSAQNAGRHARSALKSG